MPTYTDLITSQHRDKPIFFSVVSLLTESLSEIQDLLLQASMKFDVDVAVGAQLDAVGRWVGISRNLFLPIEGAYFSWNTAGLGWNESNWKGALEPSQGIVTLDDVTYRAVIKTKIFRNYWDGSNESLLTKSVDEETLLGARLLILDNLNMTMTVFMVNLPPNSVFRGGIKQGLFTPKPSGIHIDGFYFSESGPIFALDVDATVYVAGLDLGSFAVNL